MFWVFFFAMLLDGQQHLNTLKEKYILHDFQISEMLLFKKIRKRAENGGKKYKVHS